MRAHVLFLVSFLVLGCGRAPEPSGTREADAAPTAGPAVAAPVGEANDERAKEARAQMKELRTALELSYLTNARYPESLADLTVPAAAGEAPIVSRIPDDPWGHAYVYVVEESESYPSFRLYSLGPDGLEGTDDDLVAPDR